MYEVIYVYVMDKSLDLTHNRFHWIKTVAKRPREEAKYICQTKTVALRLRKSQR